MSWSIEGRTYHSWSEYEKALARQKETRLRRLVERLEIPRADTSRLESELAVAQVRRETASRLVAQLRHDAAGREEMLRDQRQRLGEVFSEVEAGEERLLQDLEGLRRDLGAKVESLEEQRRAAVSTAADALEQELAVDRKDASSVRERVRQLADEAVSVLAGLEKMPLAELGLDGAPARALLDRARSAAGPETLELARRARDEARALEAEALWRDARLNSLRDVYRAELGELRNALEIAPADRRDLVGEGAAALDAPLQREIDRLLERVESVRAYEDHEARFERIGQSVDSLALRVSDLAAQIRDFDTLENARLDLVRNHLETRLRESLGEEVRILEVEPGALGLQPVEVRLRAVSGEKVDCSVYIDGTLRIHHYGHADQASCARAAQQLTESLPALMATREAPRLDVAAAAEAHSAGREARQTVDARHAG